MSALARRRHSTTTDSAAPVTPLSHQRHRIWLCAYFPELALLASGLDSTQAVGLLETQQGRPLLSVVSPAAREAGISAGLTAPAAQALCPNLRVQMRDHQQEQMVMQRLAEAALAFSPWVSVQANDALLLEVSSCLSLFGGIEALSLKLRQRMQNLGYTATLTSSPSFTAALTLARNGIECHIDQPARLRTQLAVLPITALGWQSERVQQLARSGIHTLHELGRLPRDGLARRFGPQLLNELDELLGRSETLAQVFLESPKFAARCALPTELEQLTHFFPAIEQLSQQLRDFLLQHDAAALALQLILLHHRAPATRLDLRLRQASRDPLHFNHLFHEKLQQRALPAPIISIELHCDALTPFRPQRLSLFDDEPQREQDWQTVLEHLQNRLGHHALRSLSCAADHRPHCASQYAEYTATNTSALPPRPLWRLPSPQPINPAQLQSLADVERIESGWWDDAPICRDYCVAFDRQQRQLWVFRERASGNWFCDGLFG